MESTKYKTALITGASRGLGRALALELASQGVALALVARREEGLKSLVTEIRTLFGADFPVVSIVADVSDKNAVYPISARAAAALGPIELLINNASSLGPTPLGLLMDTDCEDLEAVLRANLVGPFRLIKAFAGPMLLRERGLILNISSDAAVESYPKWGSYSVSKAALDHLGRVLAAELEGTGVRVISVDPGEMNTRMHAEALPDADPSTLSDPAGVAGSIARMLAANLDIPSGARVLASKWGAK